MRNVFLQFYSREEIQERILEVCQDREASPRYGQGFGRRPDVLQFSGDLLELARKGATSFHISEERWNDPLALKPGMMKKDLDENRKGWDIILDIDTSEWNFAKLTTYFLIEALKFHDVKNVAVKFSGNKGFHIAVPFESFPDEVNNIKIKDWFPEGAKIIAEYLQEMIRPMLINKILENENIEELCERIGKKRKEVMKDEKFDPFTIVDIDTILISNRHLFRAPYSLHEKSELVSVPIEIDDVLKFDKEEAKPENVKGDKKFLEYKGNEKDSKQLFIQAFDWWGKKNAKRGGEGLVEEEVKKKEFYVPKNAIPENHFPACITKLLEGNLEDGKKRALFVLVNFFKSIGWRQDDIADRLKEWNKRNKEPLSPSYLAGQLSWHKKQKEVVLPPNCTNNAYYRELKVACEEHVCAKFKNPVNCAKRSYRQDQEVKNKKLKKVRKKMAKAKKVKKVKE